MSAETDTRVARRPRRRRHVVRLLLILLGGLIANLIVTSVAWWRLPHATLADGTSVDPAVVAPLLADIEPPPDEPIAERWRSWGLTVIEVGGRFDLDALDPNRPAYAAKGSITVHDAGVRVSFGWPVRCVYFERPVTAKPYRSALVLERVTRDAAIGRRRLTTEPGAKIPIWRGHFSRPWGVVIPLGLHWPGMIANVLVYAVGLWLIGRCLGATRRAIRRRRGRCPACGYPLGVSPVCTECGAVLAAADGDGDGDGDG